MPEGLYVSTSDSELQKFESELDDLMQSLEDDPWNGCLATISAEANHIIDDSSESVRLYLRNIEMLWQLGVKPT